MDVKEILPTGTCFDDAIDLLEEWMAEGKPMHQRKRIRATAILAHGICTNRDTGQVYAHAWVELDGDVWQCGLIDGGKTRVVFSVARDGFYKEYQAREVTLYTVREMALQNLKYGHFGPWREKYHKLTRNNGTSMHRSFGK